MAISQLPTIAICTMPARRSLKTTSQWMATVLSEANLPIADYCDMHTVAPYSMPQLTLFEITQKIT